MIPVLNQGIDTDTVFVGARDSLTPQSSGVQDSPTLSGSCSAVQLGSDVHGLIVSDPAS